MPASSPFIVPFDEADASDVNLLGGKGAGLAEMTQVGLPVPPGFIITTEACRQYLADGKVPEGLFDAVAEQLAVLERSAGKRFGGGPVPLLLSVRSGAPISMPGMMDTILDLGLSRDAAIALGERSGSARFVADVTRRFQSMYAQTVLGALDAPEGVEEVVAGLSESVSPGEAYDQVWAAGERAVEAECDEIVPADPVAQLHGAITAVFRSWNTRRARTYREHHRIPHDLGTAVVVQSMVFGNLDGVSGSGVAFTRNPIDGEPSLYGEFLFGGQGEDVVSGEFTPEKIDSARDRAPEVFDELDRLGHELEVRLGDVLDIEFTVEQGRLYFLQVRSAKRTAEAAVRIANDLWAEGHVEPGQALAGVSAEHIRQITRPGFEPAAVESARADGALLATGTGACPGQVSGKLCFDSDRAKKAAEDGSAVILARPVTSPADLHGMIAAQGIITSVGGATSHAAVVARALGTACVVGCADARIDVEGGTLTASDVVVREGDLVSLDGNTGELFAGEIPVEAAASRTAGFGTLLGRCSDVAGSQVWGRATLPQHVARVRESAGSGLVLGLDDLLAASGDLEEILKGLMVDGPIPETVLAKVRSLVGELLTPMLEAAGDLPVSARAIDVLADESREFFQQTPLLTARPMLTLPLGAPDLLKAQGLGVIDAVAKVGRPARTTLAVRHVSGVGEAAALARLTDRVNREHPGAEIQVGIYATSAAALSRASWLQEFVPLQWVELKTLQAVHHGLPPRTLLTRQPLDAYLDEGLLQLDPRVELDPAVANLLSGTPDAGIRVTMPPTERLVDSLYALGHRRFATEGDEVAPMILCLAKAALATGLRR